MQVRSRISSSLATKLDWLVVRLWSESCAALASERFKTIEVAGLSHGKFSRSAQPQAPASARDLDLGFRARRDERWCCEDTQRMSPNGRKPWLEYLLSLLGRVYRRRTGTGGSSKASARGGPCSVCTLIQRGRLLGGLTVITRRTSFPSCASRFCGESLNSNPWQWPARSSDIIRPGCSLEPRNRMILKQKERCQPRAVPS